MQPSVGRIVHHVSCGTPGGEYTSQCRAAIVTEVCDNPGGIDPETGSPCASLAVLNPTGMFFNTHVPYEHEDNGPGGKPRGGTWHWPERV